MVHEQLNMYIQKMNFDQYFVPYTKLTQNGSDLNIKLKTIKLL